MRRPIEGPSTPVSQDACAHILTPCEGRDKDEAQKQANRAHAKPREFGERANAQLRSRKFCASCAGMAALDGDLN
jgi:hypothetical protein